ncbi:MAG: hypothetical protein IT382_02640 [Deltaproteobacteria bacterium]|nr:hypothetical protein [Deltaproteobacteria bacterium]
MRARLLSLLPWILMGASCAHHVVLDRAPAASAPVEVRRAFFDDHSLDKPDRGELSVRTRLFAKTPTVTRRHATLKNGTPIERVEDLRPLVPEGSAASKAMDQAVEARGRADALMASGGAVAGLGLAAGFALVGTDLGIFPGTARVPTQEAIAPPLTLGGIGAAAGGALIGGFLVAFGSMARDEEDDATSAAFGAFDADLRRGLALDAAP